MSKLLDAYEVERQRYEASLRNEGARDAVLVLAAIVLQLGGEVRVTTRNVLDAPRATVYSKIDPLTGDTIYRVDRSQA